MKIGVTPKLFFAFLLTSAVVVILMTALLHWSFGHSFLSYVHQAEVQRLEPLIAMLAEAYGEEGNWQFLRNNRRRWRQMLAANSGRFAYPGPRRKGRERGAANSGWPQDPRPPGPPFEPPFEESMRPLNRPPPGRLGPPPPPPRSRLPGQPRPLVLRLALLDGNLNHVIGHRNGGHDDTRLPIRYASRTVGWLSISPPEFLSDQLDVQFQAQQSRTFWLIAVISIATAALMAVLLARHLLAPIRGLTKGARALTAGQFGARAQVTSSDELGQLAADFNILAETLEQNERARRQWVADISHELRTPLAVLRGEIEAMEDGVRPFDASSLKSIHGEVLRLAKLVEDLYELSLSDLGALNYRKEKTDLIEALDAALTAFSHRFAQQEISVTSSLNHDRPILVFADAQRLFQLFSNLLENSLRYTDSGGQLRVRCEETDKLAIMHFQDSAPGVSEEALPKLFERLYRVESSRNRARGGAGLGLAICKNIVAAHGGEITALSSPLGGLWIRIQLPLNSS